AQRGRAGAGAHAGGLQGARPARLLDHPAVRPPRRRTRRRAKLRGVGAWPELDGRKGGQDAVPRPAEPGRTSPRDCPGVRRTRRRSRRGIIRAQKIFLTVQSPLECSLAKTQRRKEKKNERRKHSRELTSRR